MAAQGQSCRDFRSFPHELQNILASEYERNHSMRALQPFFDSSLPFIKHPEVQQWGEDLATERSRCNLDGETDSSTR